MKKIAPLLTVNLFLSGCAGVATVASCGLDPAIEDKPQQKHQEYPLHIEYEQDGASHVLNDTLICEYKGRACDGRGMHNDWSRKLSSGNSDLELKTLSDANKLIFTLYTCGEIQKLDLGQLNGGVELKTVQGSNTRVTLVREQQLWEQYQTKLISYRIARKP